MRRTTLCLIALGSLLASSAVLADEQSGQSKDQIDKMDAPVPDKIVPNNQPKPTVTTPPTHCEMVAPSQGSTDLPKSKTDKNCDS
jgi:hypothetical protein